MVADIPIHRRYTDDIPIYRRNTGSELEGVGGSRATPIYRYIEFKGQFQVISSSEMAIMGVMLSLGFTKIGDFSRILEA